MSVLDKKVHKDAAFARKEVVCHFGTVTISMTDALRAVINPRHDFQVLNVDYWCRDETGTASAELMIAERLGSGVMGGAVGLAKHSTPEQLAVTAFSYLVAGDYRQKAAATGLTFTAAHVITASTYGIILVQINAAGTISTKVPSATQAYASAALALAAKPAVDSGNVEIGYIQIANNAGDWTANTDDLTDASDVTTATFTSSASIGRAVLGSDIAFADTSFGAATLSTTLTDIRGSEDDAIFVLYTTDGTGALLDAGLQITFRPYGINGDAAMIR